MVDPDAFRKKLERRAAENRAAFNGTYKDQLNDLLGLSREEIDKLTPDTTDLQVYDQLITVVKEASANNLAQAELVGHIKSLGSLGMSIAKQVPGFANLLGGGSGGDA